MNIKILLKAIINKFVEHFISKKQVLNLAFFGDSWQTIYQSQKACGLIEHDNIIEIKSLLILGQHQKL